MNQILLLASLLVAVALFVSWIASRPRGAQFTPLANAITSGTHMGDLPITLEAAVARRHLLLKQGAADNGALICTAADKPLGFAEDEGAIGDKIAMHRLGMGGRTALGVASGAIAANARLTPAAGGKVRTLTGIAAGTYWVCAEAIEAAADDEEIEVIGCVPFQVVIP
jgi:hypothetical protein